MEMNNKGPGEYFGTLPVFSEPGSHAHIQG